VALVARVNPCPSRTIVFSLEILKRQILRPRLQMRIGMIT
jgi:hypothetical protein